MPELNALHVIRDGTLPFGDRHHLLGRHKQKLRVRINEFPDQPWAGDPVDLHSFSRNPLHVSFSPLVLSRRLSAPHRRAPGKAKKPMIAATATNAGSGSFFTFQSSPTATSAISAVIQSLIDRSARTITAPVIAPIAAAVTPSTNATSAGRLPYFLNYGAGRIAKR